MTYDAINTDHLSLVSDAGTVSMGAFQWNARGGTSVTDAQVDRFLLRLAITTLNLEELEQSNALPYPERARVALAALAFYLRDIGYLSSEAADRIDQRCATRDDICALEWAGPEVALV